MINILLVDDSNDKVAHIIKVIREVSQKIIFDVVVDFVSAQEKLIAIQYDLLILDINLPIRSGDKPNFEVGKNLLSEINRKSILKSPYYIIGLTQYLDECNEVSNIWRTIEYSPETIEWKNPISNLITHIIKCGFSDSREFETKPTVFLEGITDLRILDIAIQIFNPVLHDRILLKSDKSAGASWVTRQIIVWAHSLKTNETSYIKAVGLLDGDGAAKNAQAEINRVVKMESAEGRTFKIFKLSASYAKHIIPIKQKGLDLPISLEEMFAYDIWEYANQQGWLDIRKNAETLLTSPASWNKYEISLKDYLNTLGLSSNEELYLKCIKEDCKEELVKYILQLPLDDRRKALHCFEKLVNDISDYFFPPTIIIL